MIVSEIEVENAEEWLETLISLEKQLKIVKVLENKDTKWRIESGMTKSGWYIKVLADKK
jgi:uncharacterized membrane protein